MQPKRPRINPLIFALVPSSWINAYDAGARISKEELYDLKAIPSMYLLDRDKRVLAKDAFEVGYIEWLLDRQPQ